MSDRIRCACRRCTIRSLMGPAVIITVGVLFLIQEMHGGFFEFWKLSPIILIVIGTILLASSLAPTEGHISGAVPPVMPAAPPNQPSSQGPGR